MASPLEGDVEKIGDFLEGQIRSHGNIFWHHLLGAMLNHKLSSTTWGGAMRRDMTIFEARKRLFKVANVFRAACAWRRREDYLKEISGVDLDEMIDFRNLKSRDL